MCDQGWAGHDNETILRPLEGFIKDVMADDRTVDGIKKAEQISKVIEKMIEKVLLS